MFTIEYQRDALRTLQRMPRNVAWRIRDKIEALALDPTAPNNNVKKLVDRPGYRLRVGDWRVIYDIEHGRLVIRVLAVAPRGGAYQ